MSDVQVRNVSVAYGDRLVLSDLTFSAPSGGSVALIGPNGAGKSTMLRTMAGLVRFGGTVLVSGHPLDELSRRDRARRIALVPQAPVIPAGMTVLDYVLLGRTPHISYWRSEAAADVEVARSSIKALDLVELEDRPVETLSGGERQRAVLARALTQEPEILLLDEPTTGLDLGHQQTFLELVEDVRHDRRTTVVSAIHDLTLAARYADHLVLLSDGVAVAGGAPGDVLSEDVVRRFYGADVQVLESPGGPVVVPLIGPDQTTASTIDPT